MTKIFLFVSLLIFFISINSLKAQITAELIKKELTGKEWEIVQYETFGMAEDPSPKQLNDKIILNADMTFLIMENGTTYQGKWSVQSPYIFCKLEETNWTRTYKAMSIENQKSIIEYKDSDLTKTLYYLALH